MKIQGCYVVFGVSLAPQVHLLDAVKDQALQQGLSLCWRARDEAQARRTVMDSVFRTKGAEHILPAWSEQCMTEIAMHYDGPHSAEVRGICAAIALGRPYSRDQSGGPAGPEGGTKVPTKPKKPKGSGPSGAFFAPEPVSQTQETAS